MTLYPRWVLFVAAASLTAALAEPSDPLAAGFAQPPAAARPLTWWHWVSGNVSKEGITADLEAMKRIGLKGAQMFTVEESDVKGPVVFMSPQWRELVHFAISESNRLGLELAMANGEGWSESGGPWITPAQSMQKVVWAESQVQGGQRVSLAVPAPLAEQGYYEDIALLAFPTLPGDDDGEMPVFTVSEAGAGRAAPFDLSLPSPGHPQWVRWEYPRPRLVSSFRIDGRGLRDIKGPAGWELQVSGDGREFHKVASVPTHGTVSLPATSGRIFRLWMPVPPPRTPRIIITGLTLAGPRIDRPEARSGIVVDRGVSGFNESTFSTDGMISPDRIITLTGKTDWDAPAGHWTLVRMGHTSTGIKNHPASPATVGLECDKLSRAAVTTHFEKGMLGAVLADAGPLAGKGLQYVLCDSWEAGCENWTPLMREEFQRRRGYALDPWLPALTGRVVANPDATQRFLWDFRRTLADLVAQNHYGVLQELAHEHHLGLYAEAVGINLPTVADELQCKGRTDIPMGEFWVGRTDVDDTKEAASAAHIYGQNIAGAEAFTATTEFGAWARDPYSLKAQGDLEFCMGINRFIFHRYAHQPWLDRKPGMSMGPWGTNFERTNTWWEPAAAWMTYLSRCQFLLQRGKFAADLCYYYGEGAPVDLRIAALKPAVPEGYDYDVCDAELLVGSMQVRDGRIVLPSGMSYRVLVLPDTDRMTVPVARKIRELVQAGATVVGPKPGRSPSLNGYPECDRIVGEIAAEVWGDCDGKTVTAHRFGAGRVEWGGSLADAIGAGPDFQGGADSQLHFIHRRDDGADLYFVSSQDTRETEVQCSFRAGDRVPELWHPDTGLRESPAMYTARDGYVDLPIHFDPSGSVFVVFRDRTAAPVDPVVSLRESTTLYSVVSASRPGLPSPVQLISQPMLRSWSAPSAELPVRSDDSIAMTAWRDGDFTATTAQGRTVGAIAKGIPVPLEITGPWSVRFPPKLGAPASAHFAALTSWTDSKVDGIKYFSGTAAYEKDFEVASSSLRSTARFLLDLGEVRNLAEVTLNGQSLGILWKAPFQVDATAAIRAGANHLEIKITNLWPNRMIGDQKLPEGQRVTWASFYPYHADSQLLPSGLLGPVVLRAGQRIEFTP